MKGIYLLLFILMVTPVLAVEYQAEYNIVEDKAIVELTYKLDELTASYSLNLPSDATAIESDREFNTLDLNYYQRLTLTSDDFNEFTVKYISKSFIEKAKDNFFILDTSDIEAENINIRVILPESDTLKYNLNSVQKSIIPTGKVGTNGKSIIIEWDQHDLDNDAILVIYNDNSVTHLGNILGFGLLIIITGFLVYLFITRFRKNKGDSRKNHANINEDVEHIPDATKVDNLSDLSRVNDGANIHENSHEELKEKLTRNLFEDERVIVEILIDKGELWQKRLVLLTGISKVKLSRRLRSLEAKGIIDKIPYGNTNKVRLKK